MTFILTALQSEARPLVDHFGLSGSDAASPFRTYRNEEITLVVSGVGRVASAAATAYAFARAGEPRDRAWLNVGTAGAADLEVGSRRLANKITDLSVGKVWYPSLVLDLDIPTAEVVTVDQPESEFERGALYDMEAAAFFAVASRLAPVELIQVLKVVSDNRRSPAANLRAADVSRLVQSRVDDVAALVAGSAALAAELAARGASRPADLRSWIGDRHFTVSQRRRLSELLSRLAVVEEGAAVEPADLEGARSASEVLASLERRLERRGAAY